MSTKLDWEKVLDLRRAANTCRSEMYGDWLRDPWSWPELNFLVKNPGMVVDRIESGLTRFERLSVPKVNFGTRPAVVQAPLDRMVLHALVNFISVPLVGDLAPFVLGWRLDRDKPDAGRPMNNGQEWLRFIAQRRAYSDESSAVLATDVTNFFGSVDSRRMAEVTRRAAGTSRPVEVLEQLLGIFNELPDRRGLPQRSTASSFLANAYLRPVDELLARVAASHGVRVLRWMDDIWVFGDNPERLRCLQLDIQDELRSIGLEINLGKTFVKEGAEARELVASQDLENRAPEQNTAASGSPFVAEHSNEDLDRQFDRFLGAPEFTDRTALRWICARIRDFERWDLLDPVVENAPTTPQGADHIARLLGQTERWRDLPEWYVEQAQGPLGLARLSWPVAQLGTMFPSTTRVAPVAALFAESLEQHQSVSTEFMALAAHRMSKWAPDDARSLLRTVGAESESPLRRRIAAITLHNLGEEPQRISKILGEFVENSDTRALLELSGKKLIRENADFDPAAFAS